MQPTPNEKYNYMNSILDDLKRTLFGDNMLSKLILINVIVFVAYNVLIVIAKLFGFFELLAISGGGAINYLNTFIMMPAQPLDLLLKPWTLVTYAFFHEGLFHILFNMLWLYWFGRIFNNLLSQEKLLDLYILGGIAGGLTYFLIYNILPSINAVSGGPLLGASGAVYAIVMGTATLTPESEMSLLLIGPVKIKWIAVAALVLSFIAIGGSNPGGNLAHMGGALMGYLYMKQLREGNDWGRPVRYVIDGVNRLFADSPSRPKMTIHKNPKHQSGRSGKSAAAQTSEEEIDRILDKINKSGYDSLSKAEKQKLYEASKGGQ